MAAKKKASRKTSSTRTATTSRPARASKTAAKLKKTTPKKKPTPKNSSPSTKPASKTASKKPASVKTTTTANTKKHQESLPTLPGSLRYRDAAMTKPTAPTDAARISMREQHFGIRQPRARMSKWIIFGTAVVWALFQLWSVLPFQYDLIIWFNGLSLEYTLSGASHVITLTVLNDMQVRSVHLAFAIFLAFMIYPAARYSPRSVVPFWDIIFALVGAFCAGYLYIFFDEISANVGILTTRDVIAAVFGLLLLLEATRRAVGLPMVAIVLACIGYALLFKNGVMQTNDASIGSTFIQILHQQWLTDQGVFGLPLGVSSSFVFMFVLFGVLIERTGINAYFLSLAYAFSHRLKCATAKYAVLSSGMLGLVSGSSIASTVASGSTSIPLLKKEGCDADHAAAITVIASTYCQLIPPVMGAAAFILLEFAGISFHTLIVTLTLPALLTYVLLLTLIHSETHRSQSMRNDTTDQFIRYPLVGGLILLLSFVLLVSGCYWLLTVVDGVLNSNNHALPMVLIFTLLYIALAAVAVRSPQPSALLGQWAAIRRLHLRHVVFSGLHYLLPVLILLWCLVDMHYSPALSAFWGSVASIIIIFTQQPLMDMFHKRPVFVRKSFSTGLMDTARSMINGSRFMIGIAVATAAAGIITGTLALTGVQQSFIQTISFWAGDSILLIILITAFGALVLGSCLPTTANFIVIASMFAGAIQIVAANAGVELPAVVILVFIFYLAIMADVTPPMGVACSAAAALSGGNPFNIALRALRYGAFTLIIPVLIIFNPNLIWLDVPTLPERLGITLVSVLGIVSLIAGLRHYFITHIRWWESALLVFIGLMLLLPVQIGALIYPPYQHIAPQDIAKELSTLKAEQHMRLTFTGENGRGGPRTVQADIFPQKDVSGEKLLDKFGVSLQAAENGTVTVSDVAFNSPAEQLDIEFDYVVSAAEITREPLENSKIYFAALVLLAGVVSVQTLRVRKERALGSL